MLLAFWKLRFGDPAQRALSYDHEQYNWNLSLLKQTSTRINPRVISDATIGLSDGLTVPFALTAGLAAFGSTRVVIYGGLAELIAGAISMGVGGYLGAKAEAASYQAQRDDTKDLILRNPHIVGVEISRVLSPYKLPGHTIENISKHVSASPDVVKFFLQFVTRIDEPAASRAFFSATTISVAYFLGGLLPLLPYFFVDRNCVYKGLYISIGLTVIALFFFGYIKSCVVVGWRGNRCIQEGCFGGMQMVIVGGAAAAAAMGLVTLFNPDGRGVDGDLV